jgi:hypothetical protein
MICEWEYVNDACECRLSPMHASGRRLECCVRVMPENVGESSENEAGECGAWMIAVNDVCDCCLWTMHGNAALAVNDVCERLLWMTYECLLEWCARLWNDRKKATRENIELRMLLRRKKKNAKIPLEWLFWVKCEISKHSHQSRTGRICAEDTQEQRCLWYFQCRNGSHRTSSTPQ